MQLLSNLLLNFTLSAQFLSFFLSFFLLFLSPSPFFVQNILGTVVLDMFELLQTRKNFQCLQVNLQMSLTLCLLLSSICFNAVYI